MVRVFDSQSIASWWKIPDTYPLYSAAAEKEVPQNVMRLLRCKDTFISIILSRQVKTGVIIDLPRVYCGVRNCFYWQASRIPLTCASLAPAISGNKRTE